MILECSNFQWCQIWKSHVNHISGSWTSAVFFSIEPYKCSAHKAGQKELPPLEKHVVSSWLSTTSGKFGEFSRDVLMQSKSYSVTARSSALLQMADGLHGLLPVILFLSVSCWEMLWPSEVAACAFVPKDLTCDLSYHHRLRVSGTVTHTDRHYGQLSQTRPLVIFNTTSLRDVFLRLLMSVTYVNYLFYLGEYTDMSHDDDY